MHFQREMVNFFLKNEALRSESVKRLNWISKFEIEDREFFSNIIEKNLLTVKMLNDSYNTIKQL